LCRAGVALGEYDKRHGKRKEGCDEEAQAPLAVAAWIPREPQLYAVHKKYPHWDGHRKSQSCELVETAPRQRGATSSSELQDVVSI
jgi:hypothetical protein